MQFSVLTFVFGNYETLHEPVETHRNVEYVCVTDNPNLRSQRWKIIYDPINSDYSPFRKVIEVRYDPFKYVSNSTCLIIDGSVQVRHIPWKLINHFQRNNYDVSTLVHPTRSNLISEIDAWNAIRNLPAMDVNLCKSWLKNINYNLSYDGLFQVTMILVQKNEITRELFSKVKSINNACSSQNSTFRVDQIVFSAIVNKFYSERIRLLPLSSAELKGHFFSSYKHNSTTPMLADIDATVIAKKLPVFNKLTTAYTINSL